jgi:hypothetical protein
VSGCRNLPLLAATSADPPDSTEVQAELPGWGLAVGPVDAASHATAAVDHATARARDR